MRKEVEAGHAERGKERWVQDFGGETQEKENTWKI